LQLPLAGSLLRAYILPMRRFSDASSARRFTVWAALVGFCLLAAGCGPRKAEDSLKRTVDGHIAHAIAGQTPTHGSVYLNQEVATMQARIALNARDIVSRHSLAEAFTRLKAYDKALAELDALDSIRPDRFETSFLRARIHHCQEDLPAALEEAERAVKLRPVGDDEMGDYFLHMFRWLSARNNGIAAEVNFLGIPYSGGPEAVAAAPQLNQRKLVSLIEHFPEFHEGYFVLGEWFASQDSDQLAVRSYLRALQLTSAPVDKERINRRIVAIETMWNAKAEASPEFVFDPEYRSLIDAEFQAAADWRAQYELAEQKLVRALTADSTQEEISVGEAPSDPQPDATKAHGIELPDAKQVEQEMHLLSYSGPAYFHVGLVAAKPARWTLITEASPYLWTAVGLAMFGLWLLKRRVAASRKQSRYQL
jgi:tetratricopeptide (TPR) repeat protein